MADRMKTAIIKGTLKFPKLHTPESFDSGTGKFYADPDGSYGTFIILDKVTPTKKIMDEIKETRDLSLIHI